MSGRCNPWPRAGQCVLEAEVALEVGVALGSCSVRGWSDPARFAEGHSGLQTEAGSPAASPRSLGDVTHGRRSTGMCP
eukprot:1492646-Heterocapsa_arctica.AAC.1